MAAVLIYSKTLTTCRVCLRTGSELRETCKSLFESYGCSSTILYKLTMIADISIQEDDGLPSNICVECLQELDAAIKFKEKCEKSNKILLGLCDEEDVKPTSSVRFAELPIPIDMVKKEDELEDDVQYEQIQCYDYSVGDLQSDFLKLESDQTKIKVASDVQPKSEIETLGHPTDKKLLQSIVKERKLKDLKLECHDCGGLFRTKCKLRVHWKYNHKFEKPVCNFCKRTFRTVAALQCHLKKRPQNCLIAAKTRIEGVGKARVFHCVHCNYESNIPRSLNNHLNIHTGNRPYTCKLCSKGFAQLSSLHGHMEVVHKIIKKQITCQHCGELVQGRLKIQRHLMKHTSRPLQCDICNKMYKTKSTLKEHLKTHSGIKAYSCNDCAASFYTQTILYKHSQKVHGLNKKTFNCDTCGHTFSSNFALKAHKIKHTEYNVSCNVCGRFYMNTEDLLTHQRVHSNEKSKCLECNKMFCNERSLKRHKTRKHKDNNLCKDV